MQEKLLIQLRCAIVELPVLLEEVLQVLRGEVATTGVGVGLHGVVVRG